MIKHINSKNLTNISRNQLMKFHNDNLQLYGHVLYLYNRNKINDFNSKNGERVNAVIVGQQQIIKEHYLTKENGEVVLVQKKIGEDWQFDEKQQPIMEGQLLEGKTEDQFNLLMNTFMNGDVPFEL